MYDANAILQAVVTKTTTFTGAGYDLDPGSGGSVNFGTPRRGVKLRLGVTAFNSTGTAGTVFTFSVQHSTDNTAFTELTRFEPITGATGAGTPQEQFLTVETQKRYIRLVETMSPSSGTPTITYYCDIGVAKP